MNSDISQMIRSKLFVATTPIDIIKSFEKGVRINFNVHVYSCTGKVVNGIHHVTPSTYKALCSHAWNPSFHFLLHFFPRLHLLCTKQVHLYKARLALLPYVNHTSPFVWWKGSTTSTSLWPRPLVMTYLKPALSIFRHTLCKSVAPTTENEDYVISQVGVLHVLHLDNPGLEVGQHPADIYIHTEIHNFNPSVTKGDTITIGQSHQ